MAVRAPQAMASVSQNYALLWRRNLCLISEKKKKKMLSTACQASWHVDSRVSAVCRAAVVGKLSTVGP